VILRVRRLGKDDATQKGARDPINSSTILSVERLALKKIERKLKIEESLEKLWTSPHRASYSQPYHSPTRFHSLSNGASHVHCKRGRKARFRRLHAHRAVGSHRYHRHPDCASGPGRAKGARSRGPNAMREQSQAIRRRHARLPRYLQEVSLRLDDRGAVVLHEL